jgi:hypothetical protein
VKVAPCVNSPPKVPLIATYPGNEVTLIVGLLATGGQPQEAPKLDCACAPAKAPKAKAREAMALKMFCLVFICLV